MRDRGTVSRSVALWRRGVTGAIASLVGLGAAATAQTPAEDDPDAFDAARAYILDETLFVPFRPSEDDFQSLRTALGESALEPDTWLLIMEHDGGRLGLVMDQMSYHHVAQGELSGEPWMVSF